MRKYIFQSFSSPISRGKTSIGFRGIAHQAFFGDKTLMSKFEVELDSARKLANQGEALKAEKLYKKLIDKFPDHEELYKELFGIWYEKGSVLGLKQWDIDWLRGKYQEHFGGDVTGQQSKNNASDNQVGSVRDLT